jgi:hypothetical protein
MAVKQLPPLSVEPKNLAPEYVRGELLMPDFHLWVALRALMLFRFLQPEATIKIELDRYLEETEDVVLAVSPDEMMIAIGTERGNVIVIDRLATNIHQINGGSAKAKVMALCFSSDSMQLTVSDTKYVTKYDLSRLFGHPATI